MWGAWRRSGNTAEDATLLLIQVALRKFNSEKVLTSLGTSASLLPQTLSYNAFPQTRSPCESHYIQNSLFQATDTLVHPSPGAVARPSAELLPNMGQLGA